MLKIHQRFKKAKVFKELCTNKRKLKGNEVMQVEENCSAILQKKIPPKLKDPCSFTIPSICAALNLGSLKEIGVVIQLADRSNAYPRGVLEDVLMQVNELVFLANFYVSDMEDDNSSMHAPLFLLCKTR